MSAAPTLLPFIEYFKEPNATAGRADLDSAIHSALHQLLNTRQKKQAALPTFPLAAASILAYGIPDISSLAFTTNAGQVTLCAQIQHAITVHEPRLKNCTVTVHPGGVTTEMPNVLIQADRPSAHSVKPFAATASLHHLSGGHGHG